MAELWHDPTDTDEYWDRKIQQQKDYRLWKIRLPIRLAFFLRKFI